jgi:hypothetical protein
VAWVDVKDTHHGPYEFHGKELLPVGKHDLYTAQFAQPTVQEPFVWEVTEGGAYRSGEYWVAERIDDKGWNAHKGGDALFLGGSVEFCKSVCERDAAAPVQESDCVLVPRDLVGAACAAIEGKRDAPKTLEQLRRYTTGDLSTPPAAPAQPAPAKIGTIGHIDNGKATLTASILSALQATKPAAQRQWVGLTDGERGKVYADWRWSDGRTSNLALCEAIEAKLKEKNNG